MVNLWVKAAATAGLLYTARRYFKDWGTTKAESASHLPGDELVGSPMARATEGVWINASASSVWPWLLQLGQDRGGLYSFEKLENIVGLLYVNADRIHPEWQNLAPGDSVRLVPDGWMGSSGISMRVVEVDDEKCLVLRASAPEHHWEAVWSFHLIAHGDDRCRLLIRSRMSLRHPGEVLLAEALGPERAFVTRGMLTGIRRRVEGTLQAEESAARAADDLRRRTQVVGGAVPF